MYTSYTLDSISKVCQDYHSRIARLEEEKYDLEYIVKGKDFQVHIDIHTQNNYHNFAKKKYFQPTKEITIFFFKICSLSNLSSFLN